MNKRIIDYLKERSENDSDKLFVSDEFQSFTFGEFYADVIRKASGLTSKGVGPEDRVLLVLEHGIDHLISYFACMHIAAIPVNLNIAKPLDGILQAASVCEAKFCITKGYSQDLNGHSFQTFDFDEVRSNEPCDRNNQCSVAYLMFTSGTTGKPKAVITSHDNTMATASSILDFAKLTRSDKELISLPLSFTFGLGHIHALIMVGGEAVLTNRRYEIGYLAESILTHKTTGFLASPSMLREMVKDHREKLEITANQLRYIVVNCTPMEVPLTQTLLDLLPNTQLYMYYGMTEASRCAYIHYNSNLQRLDFTGKHTLNVELKIDQPNESGIGEICMKGPNVMPGYWNNPEETAKVIDSESWIHSGDLGIMDDDGYVKVLGRINDQISVDGMKCQPIEVESVIKKLSFIEEVAVCGVSDSEKFQVVGAAIRLRENADHKTVINEIHEQCSQQLEAFKVPAIIEIVDTIPSNELGKINRKILAKQLEELKPLEYGR